MCIKLRKFYLGLLWQDVYYTTSFFSFDALLEGASLLLLVMYLEASFKFSCQGIRRSRVATPFPFPFLGGSFFWTPRDEPLPRWWSSSLLCTRSYPRLYNHLSHHLEWRSIFLIDESFHRLNAFRLKKHSSVDLNPLYRWLGKLSPEDFIGFSASRTR